jgi:hypothetical protein
MLAHRFREFEDFDADQPVLARLPVGSLSAFMLCPLPMPATCQAHAEYLYRIAFERAQAEVARERRARWTAFSLN